MDKVYERKRTDLKIEDKQILTKEYHSFTGPS